MQVGFLTAPFGGESLEYVVEFASKAGFDCLEVVSGPGGKHINSGGLGDAEISRIRGLFDAAKLRISSLAWYTNLLDPEKRQESSTAFRELVDVAKKLDVDVVCTLGGMPAAGKDRFQTIEDDCKEVFTPLVEYAGERGIKIALENWFATNLQNLAHFDRMFQVIPHENFGLNYDPSHLVHQEIDYLKAVHHFKDRIFHTHAKDTEIRYWERSWIGTLNPGWWRYVIPGYGVIDWGVYFAQLRRTGYNNVVSIEHEDGALGREEGMEKGLAYLRQFA